MNFIKPKTCLRYAKGFPPKLGEAGGEASNPKPITYQLGFSTLEVMIAMVILILAVSAVILVLFGGQSVTTDAQTNQEALYMAQKELETARAKSRGTVSDFDSIITTVATASGDIYSKQLVVSDISPCSKKVSSNIDWMLEQRSQSVGVTTILTSTDAAVDAGGDCGPSSEPVSEWLYPNTFVSVDLKDFGGPNNGTSATSIDIMNKDGKKYAILSTKHSDGSTNDAWIFDVTTCVFDDEPANCIPALAGSLNVNSDSDGLTDLDAVSNFAFALTAGTYSTPSELNAIDINTIVLPNLTASKSLGIAGSDPENLPNADAVFYHAGKIYVGTHKTGGTELQIFNATAPFNLLGSLEITHNIRDIIVRGNYAYLATSDNSGEVMIVDVSDPSAMVHPDITGMKFDAPGDYDATVIYLLGNKLYLGRAGGYNDPTKPNFLVLDINEPDSITSLGSKYITRNPNLSLSVITLLISGKFAFMGTDDSNAEFQVFIVDDAANIKNCSEPGYPDGFVGCGKYDFPAKITDLELHSNLIYAAIDSNDAFRIIFDNLICYNDPSDPSCN